MQTRGGGNTDTLLDREMQTDDYTPLLTYASWLIPYSSVPFTTAPPYLMLALASKPTPRTSALGFGVWPCRIELAADVDCG